MELKNFNRIVAETSPEKKAQIAAYMDMLDKIYETYQTFRKGTDIDESLLCDSVMLRWHQYLAYELTKTKNNEG